MLGCSSDLYMFYIERLQTERKKDNNVEVGGEDVEEKGSSHTPVKCKSIYSLVHLEYFYFTSSKRLSIYCRPYMAFSLTLNVILTSLSARLMSLSPC